MRRFFPDLAFMALRLRNARVRLHKYPFISIIYHNLTLHIIMSAANSDIVTQELEVPPSCIIKHPGFYSLCLDKWAPRYAATKMRTKKKQKYRQISTEDS